MELRMDVGQVYLFENLLSQWTTLSLLGKIEYELEDIQNEKGEILLERFNEIIAINNILNPFLGTVDCTI